MPITGTPIVEGCIVLCSTIAGMTRYRPPIGPRNPELLADVLRLAAKSEEEHPFVILDPETKEWMDGLYPDLQFHAERKYFEYVYLASDLAELPGKKYLTIRHQLNKFQKTCMPQVEMISEENLGRDQGFPGSVVRLEGLRLRSGARQRKRGRVLCLISL